MPAFVVNGNSLESDLPFLAFFLAAIAFSAAGFWSGPAPCMALAAMIAYQAVFLVPILAAHTWIFDRHNPRRWLMLLTPAATIAAWQIFSRLTTGKTPASELAGYLVTYGFAALLSLPKGAAMLSIHAWFILFPALLPLLAVAAWRSRREPGTRFLMLWIVIFFLCGLPIFFAGSARYLLPIAAPMAILASRLPVKWIAPAFAIQLAIGLGLAAANYQHWDGYRSFAASIRNATAGHRVCVDNDWGLRYYLEADHALPAKKGQHLRPGDIVVTSELGHNVEFTAPMATIARAVIQPSVPFRLIGLDSDSGYSTVAKGWWPFGISTGVVDRVEARIVKERHPTLEYLPTNSPGARPDRQRRLPGRPLDGRQRRRRPQNARRPQTAARGNLRSAQRPRQPHHPPPRWPRSRLEGHPRRRPLHHRVRRPLHWLHRGSPRRPHLPRPRRPARSGRRPFRSRLRPIAVCRRARLIASVRVPCLARRALGV